MSALRRARGVSRILVFLVLLTLLSLNVAVGGAPADSAVLVASAPAVDANHSKKHYQGPFALVLVIDAARFDEINLNQMPNLARLVAGGTEYTQAWVGQLPSITETSHATIGTGVFPSRHLVLGDTWRVPGKEQMAPNLLSGELDRTGYIGKFIKATGVPTLAAAVHKLYPGSVVVTLSGHKIYAADGLGAGDADYVAFGGHNAQNHFVPLAIPGHAPVQSILQSPQLDLPNYPTQPGVEDAWTTTLTEKFLFAYHPRLMMVNWPEVDINGHIAGTSATVMQPLFSNIDQQIGRLVAAYGRAGMLSQTYFIITADHAMVPRLHAIGSTRIEQIIQSAGGQALYVGHGDYCPIWLKNLAAVPRVAVALANANLPNVAAVYAKNIGGIYTLVSSPAKLADPGVLQTYSDLLASFNSEESADIVLVYEENTITMTPLFQKINRLGDHGGATWGSQHIPLILAGPGIRQAYVSSYPARLVDIAPTVETLLGGQPFKQDGVPLADAMINPPPWAVVAQAKQSAHLTSDVTAFEHEAAVRPNSR